MSEENLYETAADGERAKALAEDEVLQKAFTRLRELYHDQWASTAPEQREDRERFYYALQGVDMLEIQLRAILQDGVVARRKIESNERNDDASDNR